MHPTERKVKEPNLARSVTRKAHIVPQFFLRPFSNLDGSVSFLDLQSGRRSRKPSVAAVAYEIGYFDVDMDGRGALSMEDRLTDLETVASPVIARLINYPEGIASLPGEEERSFSQFLASLRFRSPAFKREYNAMRADTVRQGREMLAMYCDHNGVPSDVRDFWINGEEVWFMSADSPWSAEESISHHLGEIKDFGAMLQQMEWKIGRTVTQLCTSDNPVAAFDEDPPGGRGRFNALTYYVPFTPNVLLRMRPVFKDSNVRHGTRLEGRFSKFEESIADVAVAGDAVRWLYGPAIRPWTQQTARQELRRHEGIRRRADPHRRPGSGDRYSKIGLYPVARIMLPGDPYWKGPSLNEMVAAARDAMLNRRA